MGQSRGRQSGRLGDLMQRYRELQDEFGPMDEDALIDKVINSVANRRRRLESVLAQIAEIEIEAQWLTDEITAREQSLELLLVDLVRRVGRMVEDGWSPYPLLGFRLWIMRGSGLDGAKVTWRTPVMSAMCLTTGEGDGIPHSDGRCGRLGCGVYATKALEPLLSQHLHAQSHGYAVGLVELTGKVIEHEHGYRAEQAKIVALAAVGVDGYLETEDDDEIADLCDAPDAAVRMTGGLRPSSVLTHLERFLYACRERRFGWT